MSRLKLRGFPGAKLLFLIAILLSLVLLQSTSLSKLSQRILPSSATSTDENNEKSQSNLGELPISFIENQGQMDEAVRYYAKGPGYTFFLTKDGITYSFTKEKGANHQEDGPRPLDRREPEEKESEREVFALKTNFLGANERTVLKGEEKQAGKVNYLIGNDPEKWKTSISTYGEVIYEDLYPGIDLRYKGDKGKLKYEFTVNRGADYKDIALVYQGADSLKLDDEGNLLISTPLGELEDERPYVYQMIDGKKNDISGTYLLNGDTVRFSVPSFNPNHILVIDPGLSYSTFLGGVLEWTREFGSSDHDYALGVAADASGNMYVAGWTGGAVPGGGGSQGLWDAFVRKYDSSGAVVWTRQFGTDNNDRAQGAATDLAGNLYVVGWTTGALPGGGYDDGSSLTNDGYVRKYDSWGNLVWTRQFGTSGWDMAYSASADFSGNVYVAGWTEGALPGGGGFSGGQDAFVRKYDSWGNVMWTRQFGTGFTDWARGVTLDYEGNVYLAGHADGILPDSAGRGGSFVKKYNARGAALWTRQFGNLSDEANASAVDQEGNIYVVGTIDGFVIGLGDSYVRKYDEAGSMVWTREFGAPDDNGAHSTSVDGAGNVYVAGYTDSALPDGGFDDGEPWVADAYVRKYDSSGKVIWTRQFGTLYNDSANDISRDTDGNVYLVGNIHEGFSDPEPHGNAYVMKFGLSVSVTLTSGSSTVARGDALGYAAKLTNNSASSQTLEYWSHARFPDGTIYPANGALFGPYTVTLSAGQTRSVHLEQPIPAIAPLGIYTYYGAVGPYPDDWDVDSFTFEVTP